ncbi:hypothetical protein E2C01_075562 [Portunus trituberculatus]|uniref:Uncharacterized protein n=1 Tax=Portunus trituberculatus TaxID=210409 RepID=A0A5B7IF98_PORTR|nr:hypothetical protein [Portunus trituberculatus]
MSASCLSSVVANHIRGLPHQTRQQALSRRVGRSRRRRRRSRRGRRSWRGIREGRRGCSTTFHKPIFCNASLSHYHCFLMGLVEDTRVFKGVF